MMLYHMINIWFWVCRYLLTTKSFPFYRGIDWRSYQCVILDHNPETTYKKLSVEQHGPGKANEGSGTMED
jgi:hypothetical protein